MSAAAIMSIEKEPPIGRNEVNLPFEQLSDVGNHSEWRLFMAERIAMAIDYEKFGVRSIYLIGSVERREAGACSDIDLLIHVDDSAKKRALLELWLDGWSKALALANYLRTGYLVSDLLDVHIVTDNEVRANDSFAAKMRDPMESYCLICGS